MCMGVSSLRGSLQSRLARVRGVMLYFLNAFLVVWFLNLTMIMGGLSGSGVFPFLRARKHSKFSESVTCLILAIAFMIDGRSSFVSKGI